MGLPSAIKLEKSKDLCGQLSIGTQPLLTVGSSVAFPAATIFPVRTSQ